MSVKTLHSIPCTLSRSAWGITIDGKVLKDWVMANFWWHASGACAVCSSRSIEGNHVQTQICMPLKHNEDGLLFARIMAEQEKHTIQFIYQKDGNEPSENKGGTYPEIVISDATASMYELLPMSLGGAQIEGLDVRSDTPVVQAITFDATLKTGERPVRLVGSKEE